MAHDGGLPELLIRYLPRVDWTRLEPGAVARGVPDLNGCRDGVEVWIECKTTAGWIVTTVRPPQIAWIERRVRSEGRCRIAVRQRGARRDTLWLLRSGAARLLFDRVRLDKLPPGMVLGVMPGGPAVWDWPAVDVALFHIPEV